MNRSIAHVTLLVKDYDEAILFYTNKLDFKLIEDTVLSENKRWVVVAPKGAAGCNLLLAKAATIEQQNYIGKQGGGRVFLFLNTDDFNRDYTLMLNKSIKFIRQPAHEAYGTVAVFEDLYGNLWDLIGP
jgi:catechol 2,3-dioxygenase-like lactoylglutathione lyase family enzyme